MRVYPLRVAAAAAQITTGDFRHSIDNGTFKLQGCDLTTSGSGEPFGYSIRRILQAAITEQIKPLGLPTPAAARAACEFTDIGNIGRQPGELYQHGRTLLVISPDGTTIKNIPHGALLTDISNSACFICVDLNRIVEQVNSVLDNESNQ